MNIEEHISKFYNENKASKFLLSKEESFNKTLKFNSSALYSKKALISEHIDLNKILLTINDLSSAIIISDNKFIIVSGGFKKICNSYPLDDFHKVGGFPKGMKKGFITFEGSNITAVATSKNELFDLIEKFKDTLSNIEDITTLINQTNEKEKSEEKEEAEKGTKAVQEIADAYAAAKIKADMEGLVLEAVIKELEQRGKLPIWFKRESGSKAQEGQVLSKLMVLQGYLDNKNILKNLVSKTLPKKDFIYDYKEKSFLRDLDFLMISSDKKFGISFHIVDIENSELNGLFILFKITYNKKGLFGSIKTVQKYFAPSVIHKMFNDPDSTKISETNFQNDDFVILKKLYEVYNEYKEKVIEDFKEQQRLKELLQRLEEEQQRLKEEKRVEKLKVSQNNILEELDKDGNGVIDVIDGGDDFMKLFRKHQTIIKEFDKEYLNHLVKVSNYLKTKRSNIQAIFLEIRKTENQTELDENVGLLNNQINTYKIVLLHSLNMITSIVEDDFITVNEIYEGFDKLKIFKSDHEKEVSEKLSGIGDGLSNLMHSINSMERNIVSGLNELSYVTQDGFDNLNSSLTRELQSIDSSLQTNNLLTVIQTYEMYKVNKNTKSLRG